MELTATRTVQYHIKSFTITDDLSIRAEVSESESGTETRRISVDASPSEVAAILTRPGTSAPLRDQVLSAAYELVAVKLGLSVGH